MRLLKMCRFGITLTSVRPSPSSCFAVDGPRPQVMVRTSVRHAVGPTFRAKYAHYQKWLLAMLGPPDDERSLAAKLDAMRTIFLTALKRGEGMCLCGTLATEAHSLPPSVANAARGYFAASNDWLARAFAQAGVAEPKRRAMQTTALFQGAMLQAVSLDDVSAFEKAVEGLRQSF